MLKDTERFRTMPKPDFTLELIKNTDGVRRLSETLVDVPAFALDIETADWWNRHRERVALIQIAFRSPMGKVKVSIIDALAGYNLSPLRLPLESAAAVKVIHNAGFDAVRLNRHYNFSVAPVFDTMLAARRAGERKYSLKAQAETHLNLRLNKSAQTGDWSRRPLDPQQTAYAALDPYAALLLYENQRERHLNGGYRLRETVVSDQISLPLTESAVPVEFPVKSAKTGEGTPIQDLCTPTGEIPGRELVTEAAALLGVIAELPRRYHPEGLAASVGAARIGLAGWIIDRRLGVDAEPDEETVKLAISRLCALELIEITDTSRLQVTESGARLWQTIQHEDLQTNRAPNKDASDNS